MGVFRSGREFRLCAFCGHGRRVYLKQHLSLFEVAISVGAGTLLLAPFVGGFDPRGIGVGAILIGFAEFFSVIRHRVSLMCPRCGFDPVIYRRSQDEAANKVKLHLKRRANDPNMLLAEPVVPPNWNKKTRASKDSSHKDSAQHV